MTNPIGRRLGRLESEIERRTDPGYGPVFRLIDDPRDPENAIRLEEADPRDPENAIRLEEAEAFKRDNPNGLIIHRVIAAERRTKLGARLKRKA